MKMKHINKYKTNKIERINKVNCWSLKRLIKLINFLETDKKKNEHTDN